jgi:dTDP-4-amino-4,6-dideoxygalactose transaminase
VKLPYLDQWNAARRAHADTYRRLLEEAYVTTPAEASYGKHVYHLFVVQTDDRDRVREVLTSHGIATGIHYPIPIHDQIASRDSLAPRILSLPMYAELEKDQLEFVSGALRTTMATSRVVVAD